MKSKNELYNNIKLQPCVIKTWGCIVNENPGYAGEFKKALAMNR